jgi:hypothetical protein
VKPFLAFDPFPAAPPTFIRADLHRYELTSWGVRASVWWRRTYVGEYLRPLRKDDPDLHEFLREMGWTP